MEETRVDEGRRSLANGKQTGCICGYNSVAEHLLQFVI